MELDTDTETPVESTIADPIDPPIEVLRSIRITPLLKVTPRQHTNSSNTLDEWLLNTANVDTARFAIWNKFRSNLKPRAIVDDTTTPPSFNISDSDPTIDDIDSYIYFETNSRKYCFGPKPSFHQITNHMLTNWDTSNRSTPITMLILKHGDAIRNTGAFQQYEKTVLQPVAADRGGAPTEPLHIQVMAQLRERHGSVYRSDSINWRLWVNEILRLPVPQQENAINQAPPRHMMQLFERVPTAADAQLRDLHCTMTLAKNVLRSCQLKLEPIKLCAEELTRRVESFEEVIGTLQLAVDSFQESLGPLEPDVDAAATSVPNIPDNDHSYLLEDG
ncbi:hypothetical protein HDU77_000354 [Chytriomyces hyalinus]|nr:hypothetical protein HDU77_000354 [Chytriomyces hyalinus]